MQLTIEQKKNRSFKGELLKDNKYPDLSLGE